MCSSDLDPALLATSGDLQEFVRWHLGISEEGRPPILDGWRGEILGGPLLDLLEAEQRAGITLTSSMAMLPGASVSGTWFWHPDARYFGIGRIGRDQLAAKEMEIGRVNQGKKNFTGAINRFKIVVTQYQTTRHVEEALLRLTECYMALGIVQEAQTAAAVLGHNFPDSPWYQDAYNLVKNGGLEPKEKDDSWITKAFKKVGLG